MTEEAVKEQLDDYIHEVATHAFHELDPTNVVNVDLPADKIKSALRQDIRQEVIGIKSGFQGQLTVFIQAVSEKDRDESFEKFLEEDIFFRNYEGDREDELRRDLRDHFDEVVENIGPLVESDEDFWVSVEEHYENGEAVESLNTVFKRSEVVEDYRDGFVMEMSLDTGLPIEEIEYTDEGLRVLKSGEEHIQELIEEKVG
ncbi:MAG: hypothetical protein ABEK59_12685 [Halobacteria archaeon]